MRLLGIDYGTKRIGVALSDEEGRIAFPHGVLTNDESVLEELAMLVENEKVTAIVIGESRDYSQKENPIMQKVRDLQIRLVEDTGLPVHLEPEILSSFEARRVRGKHEDLDASAAAIILQSYIDKTRAKEEDEEHES